MYSRCSAYFFRKLVEISSRVSSHGEDKDERRSRGGVSEHQTQFSCLRLNEPLAQVVGNKVLRECTMNNNEHYSYVVYHDASLTNIIMAKLTYWATTYSTLAILLHVSVCPYLHTVGQFIGTDAFQDDHFLEVIKVCIPVAR